MNKFEKGIYDLLLKEKEKSFFNQDEIKEIDNIDDDWLANQYTRYLKEQLANLNNLEEKLDFLNKMTLDDNWTSTKAIKKDTNSSILENISINKIITKNLWASISSEFQTSEDIKIISPFISNQMINLLDNIIDNNSDIKKIKIITTTYDGTSKFLALEDLIKLKNKYPNIIDAKIEDLFKSNAKRLHIKSYLFDRKNDFSSLYIGSSNFTKTGMIVGKEHNVRISEFKDKKIIEDFRMEFDSLFYSDEYIDIQDNEKIQQIIMRQKIENSRLDEIRKATIEVQNNISDQFDRIAKQNNFIQPYPYQKEVMNNVISRIKEGKTKHLLVMATGTGKTKTMIFTYEALSQMWKKDEPSLLYIAPSKEILDQTVSDFRDYLDIYDFGIELYDSRNNDVDIENEDRIFTNIETLIRRKDKIKNKKFDIVVFDEAHHVEADTFQEIYSAILPNTKQLFGLTATPERTDKINVNRYFDDEFAANIRLFEAIDKELLSDFDYYFIKDDSTDLTNVDLQKVEKLNKVLNIKKRHEFVFENINQYIGQNSKNVKAILFCNSVEHAQGLSSFLNDNGLRSSYLVSEKTSKEERRNILRDFKNGDINFLCVRDILNEGVDVPEIDTVMFLRPTASTLIYLQQLGRGLRRLTDKRLQVFDFVNNVDIKINKKYNPLMAINVLTNDLKINQFEKNINSLNSFLPGDSNFVISKMVKEDFLNKLKVYEKYNLYSEILDEYRTGYFEDYESFFIDKGVNIYEFYNSKKAYFKENNQTRNQTIVRQFIFFNNENLIKEILFMIKNKIKSKNKLINNIFLVTYHHSPTQKDPFYYDLDLAFETIFNGNNDILLKEITYLLKFKLNNEVLIKSELTDKIHSFKGSHFNHNQLMALCSINIKEDKFKGKGVGGILSNVEDKLFAIDASTSTISTRFGHGNIFDRDKNILYWDSPDEWKFDKTQIKNQQENMMNLKEYSSYVFFSDENLVNLKGEKAKEFIGQVELIIDRIEVKNVNENKTHTKPKFIFKIN